MSVLHSASNGLYRKYVKRLFDIVFSFTGIIVLSPVFLLIAVAIKVESKGPVFFIQTRVGTNKELFKMLKFRSMKVDTPKDTPTHLL